MRGRMGHGMPRNAEIAQACLADRIDVTLNHVLVREGVVIRKDGSEAHSQQ